MSKIPLEVKALVSNEFKRKFSSMSFRVFRPSACVAGGERNRIMSGFQDLKQDFMTEWGLDIIKTIGLK